jgi:hypothetical protein
MPPARARQPAHSVAFGPPFGEQRLGAGGVVLSSSPLRRGMLARPDLKSGAKGGSRLLQVSVPSSRSSRVESARPRLLWAEVALGHGPIGAGGGRGSGPEGRRETHPPPSAGTRQQAEPNALAGGGDVARDQDISPALFEQRPPASLELVPASDVPFRPWADALHVQAAVGCERHHHVAGVALLRVIVLQIGDQDHEPLARWQRQVAQSRLPASARRAPSPRTPPTQASTCHPVNSPTRQSLGRQCGPHCAPVGPDLQPARASGDARDACDATDAGSARRMRQICSLHAPRACIDRRPQPPSTLHI